MISKSLRNVFCATAAAVCWLFSFGAQAAYDIGWDPTFAGHMLINFDPTICVTSETSCPITIFSLDFTDSTGRGWDLSPSPQTLDGFVLLSDGMLEGISLEIVPSLVPPPILLASVLVSQVGPCDDIGPLLTFQIDGRPVNFSCGALTDTSMYTITLVPEPATLALLGLGLSGLALTRRRRRS